MMRHALLLVALIAAPAAAEIQAANPFHERLLTMKPLDRNAVFRRTVMESGLRCKRVVQSSFQQRYRNLMMWRVECDPKRSLAIFVGPDASVQVRDCADAAQLRLPACTRQR